MGMIGPMDDDGLIPRRIAGLIEQLLGEARGLVIGGPRQAGKSELLRLIHRRHGGTYRNLDDAADLRAARLDPTGFLLDQTEPILIDEYQRAGEPLLRAVKAHLDRSRRPGQVVLTGSTRFLTEPRLAESLAGRVRLAELWPLSQGEIDRVEGGDRFIDRAFRPYRDFRRQMIDLPPIRRRELAVRICRGGFPEAVLASTDAARRRFFASYVQTVASRDIRELGQIAQRIELPGFLRLLAARTAQELNVSDLANDAALGSDSTRRYLPLVETVYLAYRLPGWATTVTARQKRRPKLHLTDSGLAAHLLGLTPDRLAQPTETAIGAVFETFVLTELLRQTTWADTEVAASHWRDRTGREVDIVLEALDRRVVAIECKATHDLDVADARHLAFLRDALGARFTHGIILHLGDHTRALGDRLTSMPVSALWA